MWQKTEHTIEGCGSGHPKRSGRKGHAGGRFEENGMSRAYGAAMVYQVQEDRAGVVARARHTMEWNSVTRPRNVDSSSLAQGVWLFNP